MNITVNNWFSTTDVSVYQADRTPEGEWNRFPDPRIDIKGGQSATINVGYKGVYITWWNTVTIEKEFGYVAVREGLDTLDVFDISAGRMPHASYASWRQLFASH